MVFRGLLAAILSNGLPPLIVQRIVFKLTDKRHPGMLSENRHLDGYELLAVGDCLGHLRAELFNGLLGRIRFSDETKGGRCASARYRSVPSDSTITGICMLPLQPSPDFFHHTAEPARVCRASPATVRWANALWPPHSAHRFGAGAAGPGGAALARLHAPGTGGLGANYRGLGVGVRSGRCANRHASEESLAPAPRRSRTATNNAGTKP